jgi:hypothetical protein
VISAYGHPANCGSPTATFGRQHTKRAIGGTGFSVAADRTDRVTSSAEANEVTVLDCVLDRLTSVATVTDYSLQFVPNNFYTSLESAVSSNPSVATIALSESRADATFQSSGSVIATLTSREGESKLVPLTFSSSASATVETFVRWADGSLGKHITDGTYSRLAGKSPPPAITVRLPSAWGGFNTQQQRWGSPINMWSVAPMSKSTAGTVVNDGNNNPAGPWIRDPSFFLADVDFTCISVWNQGTNGIVRGTLVTPEHFISCAHGWQPGIGDTLYFAERSAAAGQSEVLHTRTVTHAAALPRVNGLPDITVGRLSSPLPASIAPAKVLPKTYGSKIKGHTTNFTRFGGDENMLPVVAFNQDFQALLHGSFTFGYLGHYLWNLPAQYRPFVNGIRWLDSGNPTFCIINDEAVLLSVHTSGFGGSFVSLASTYDAIETLMASQGGATTTLTPVDLSSFTSYTGQTVPGAPTITLAQAGQSVQWTTPSDGNSPLTGYRFYAGDILIENTAWTTISANAYGEGEVVQVSAVNAVGEGPKSAPVTVAEE